MNNKKNVRIVRVKVKKRKFKIKKIFFLLVFIVLICCSFKFLNSIPLKNIVIIGNDVLLEQKIIEDLKLENYPSYLSIKKSNLESLLKKNPLVDKVTVKKDFFNRKVTISIKEEELLFIYNNKVILSSFEEIDNDNYSIAVVSNYIDKDYYESFIKAYNKIDSNIRDLVSEIKYIPNEVDKERFLLYLTDSNQIYMTISKIDNVNNYIDLKSKVGDNKGSFHLDSGTYFERG